MSNLKLIQRKHLTFIEQEFPYLIYRVMRDQSSAAAHVPCFRIALVLMIHSQMKSMENRSENHLTLSMEKQVHTQRWHLRTVPVFEPCRLVLRIRFFQIKMIICSTTHKMRCKQTKRIKSSRISIENWWQRRL